MCLALRHRHDCRGAEGLASRAAGMGLAHSNGAMRADAEHAALLAAVKEELLAGGDEEGFGGVKEQLGGGDEEGFGGVKEQLAGGDEEGFGGVKEQLAGGDEEGFGGVKEQLAGGDEEGFGGVKEQLAGGDDGHRLGGAGPADGSRGSASRGRGKQRLRGVILRLQDDAVHTIVCALAHLKAPQPTAAGDAITLAAIAATVDEVAGVVRAAGGATTLGPRRHGRGPGGRRGRAPRIPEWSGVDAPFVAAGPFLERFLSMRGDPVDHAAFVGAFKEACVAAEPDHDAYMARFQRGDGRHDDDPGLDARLAQHALAMEAPLMGMLFFQGPRALEVLTTSMDTGEPMACPQEVWDEYAFNLMPPTDGQELFLEAAHAWWSRESLSLVERRRALAERALAAPEDHTLQHEIVDQLIRVRPYWATLTGVLDALHRRRERLRAAARARAQGLPTEPGPPAAAGNEGDGGSGGAAAPPGGKVSEASGAAEG
ncbi:MAG: hypothetical protein J3K34DRAFT_462221 [Monoraphidium minutum]|nr:MAG: hypothetical protein J3K34DRAFT_462221 [Monoraphidium minutum]